ncbi:MAG TPA: glycosyltransferase family 4 protein [Polyangia bacterium]|nr:glycosyltransferase family 4 protein [Polyangia bacterium]
MSVLVSHPHVAAVSVGLANALEREHKLAGYYTGIAFSLESQMGRLATRVAGRAPTLRNRLLAEIPPERLHAGRLLEVCARLGGRVAAALGGRRPVYDALFSTHDRAVSMARWPGETTAVYAYEDGARRTFERARRRDLERIWDLPLPHYLTIEETVRDESRRWPGASPSSPDPEPAWKRATKDAELALATKVSVASAFTKRSLERLDVRVPIAVGPYGFPIEGFAPKSAPPSGPFKVLAVGTQDLRKGTPYLLEAWRRAALKDAELHIVGSLRLTKAFLDRYAGLFVHWPPVAKSELAHHYSGADLLAFPTLGDGFGLVIQEAMCAGTPVVTTPCGGGPECITDGVDGWIVPPRDIDALVERLRAAAADRDGTGAIGRAARARAERSTWREAGTAILRALDL